MGMDNEQMAALYGAWDAWTRGEMTERKIISEEALLEIYRKEFEKHSELKNDEMAASYLLVRNQDGISGDDRKIELRDSIPITVAYDAGYKFGLEKWDVVKEISKRTF